MTIPEGFKATKNQLMVAENKAQGNDKKVLCVCSAGVLRSPTMANILHRCFGYNCRAVGTTVGFALISISEALIHWADEIVFVDFDCYDIMDSEILECINESGTTVKILDVPDDYNYGIEELENLILELYTKS